MSGSRSPSKRLALQPSTVVGGLTFPEGPRWYDGRLWFTDIHAGRVMTLDGDGHVTVVAETKHPTGLGWLPDGRLVISTSRAPYVKAVAADGTVAVLHDLSELGPALNDMVVAPDGRIYVDVYTELGNGPPRGGIALITPDGDVRMVTTDLATPNGLAITADGSTLLASETFGGRLLAFPILADGSLGERRVYAELGEGRLPDGVCLDVEGGAWVGSFNTGEFLRVLDGGAITHVISTPGRWAVAPALGGPDRRTLYLLTAQTTYEQLARGDAKGYIDVARVEASGAGWP